MRSLPTCTSSFGAVRDVIDAKPAEECSHVNNDPAPCSNAIMEDAAQINTITAMSFPQKLMILLDDGRFNQIISWELNGKAFTVHDINSFSTTVLPLFSTKLNCTRFMHKLQRWGFFPLHSNKGRDTYTSFSFAHKDFQRGDFELCSQITRRQMKRQKPTSSNPPAVHSCHSNPQSSLREDTYSPHAHLAELGRNLKKLYCGEDSSAKKRNLKRTRRQDDAHGEASVEKGLDRSRSIGLTKEGNY